MADAFERLRSIQFDPIAPVGCNHDLVLQARVPSYKIGDWESLAYQDRHVYDGWDKQASLVPFSGWPLRRFIYDLHRKSFETKIFEGYKDGVAKVLEEITVNGPMMPRDFEFQARKEEWKDSWLGPSVTKQILRALWHAGLVMTSGRKAGQHQYDLTERVVPQSLRDEPLLDVKEAKLQLALDRYKAMGLVRPNSPPEVWSMSILSYDKKHLVEGLAARGETVEVDVEGMRAHATPGFLKLLDQPSIDRRIVFIAPLDPFMWDRKMTEAIFGFEYTWEIYMPEHKRRWGYYVLPILFGDELVARVEFWARKGVLEIRKWHFEPNGASSEFLNALPEALMNVMRYCSANQIIVAEGVNSPIPD
ncbi:MAG TPA: crosslink repair DNA glycosylase YcaQ family protein, partial [Fimbriimonas sp.]|nr:crosslink repair DNA glycosylase YcaQ family protein [Fimbriimonas sp.]